MDSDIKKLKGLADAVGVVIKIALEDNEIDGKGEESPFPVAMGNVDNGES